MIVMWQKYSQLVNIIVAGASGSLATVVCGKILHYGSSKDVTDADDEVLAASIWEKNWDCREPEVVLHTMKQQQPEPVAYRHVILVRHGEYINFTDGSHHLTERGRLQALFTGQRLQALGMQFDNVVTSTMTRAQETAKIIIKEINFDPLKLKKCTLLPEGMPIPPVPSVRRRRSEELSQRDGPRIEAAFRRYFFRASPHQQQDSYLLIIGHANVMRYLVCRALQFPPEAWSRISINHGSITWLTIGPSGNVTIRYLGDTGFMPVEHLTVNKPKIDQEILEKSEI